jgi:hypothetical protein
MTRYRPCLIVTQSDAHHEHILAATAQGQSPWPIVWTRRALQMPQLEESTALDLLRLLLDVGTLGGLFKNLHQEGLKVFYAIASDAAILHAEGVSLLCSASERIVVRPPQEALCGTPRPAWSTLLIMDAMCGKLRHDDNATIRIATVKGLCDASSPRNIRGCSARMNAKALRGACQDGPGR